MDETRERDGRRGVHGGVLFMPIYGDNLWGGRGAGGGEEESGTYEPLVTAIIYGGRSGGRVDACNLERLLIPGMCVRGLPRT